MIKGEYIQYEMSSNTIVILIYHRLYITIPQQFGMVQIEKCQLLQLILRRIGLIKKKAKLAIFNLVTMSILTCGYECKVWLKEYKGPLKSYYLIRCIAQRSGSLSRSSYNFLTLRGHSSGTIDMGLEYHKKESQGGFFKPTYWQDT